MTNDTGEHDASHHTVDARGRRCPLPIIDLAAAAKMLPVGAVITLLADDPAAAADVPAWCRMRGQAYEGSLATVNGPSYRIRLLRS